VPIIATPSPKIAQKPKVYQVLITKDKLLRFEDKNLSNKANVPLAIKNKDVKPEEASVNKGEIGKIGNIIPKQSAEIAYSTRETDNDLSVFDGKNEASLESIFERNKLSYQYYNNKLFLYNNGLRGKEINYEKDGINRHFLFYESEFYEFFDNQYDKADLKLITDSNLIYELKLLLSER